MSRLEKITEADRLTKLEEAARDVTRDDTQNGFIVRYGSKLNHYGDKEERRASFTVDSPEAKKLLVKFMSDYSDLCKREAEKALSDALNAPSG